MIIVDERIGPIDSGTVSKIRVELALNANVLLYTNYTRGEL